MPFDNKGNYTPASGATNAVPGQVIRSATWDAINVDYTSALTTLGNIQFTQNARTVSTPGAVTILTTDALVEITVSISVINLPASSLMLWPVRIAGDAAGIFSTKNSVVTPNGTDKINGQSTFTLTADFQVINLTPLPVGGWLASPIDGSNASNITTGLLAPSVGGTGVNNASRTLTINTNSGTLSFGTAAATITFQGTDTYVGRATTDTLTNKTIDTAGPNTLKINGNTLSATAAGTATISVPNTTSTLLSTAGQTQNVSLGNPASTTSTTGVMMGLGASAKLTPTFSSRVILVFSGVMSNSTAGDGGTVTPRFGTGAAPANGAALTGTALTNVISASPLQANISFPFCVVNVITGLTPGTAYWFDIGLAAVTGGTISLFGVSSMSMEM